MSPVSAIFFGSGVRPACRAMCRFSGGFTSRTSEASETFAAASIFELISQAHARARIVLRRRSRLRRAARADGRLQLEMFGEIDLHLGLRSAGSPLLGTDEDAVGDIFSGFDRTAGAGGVAADAEPVEAEPFAHGGERIGAAAAAQRQQRVGDLGQLNGAELLHALTEQEMRQDLVLRQFRRAGEGD